jgi:hypothetical protein
MTVTGAVAADGTILLGSGFEARILAPTVYRLWWDPGFWPGMFNVVVTPTDNSATVDDIVIFYEPPSNAATLWFSAGAGFSCIATLVSPAT